MSLSEPLLVSLTERQQQQQQQQNRSSEDKDCCSKMRKYYKLVLVVVAVASFVCFLFYKTQYDKLYGVLEVMEFFGKADQQQSGKGLSTDCHQSSSSSLFIPPTFVRVDDDLFAYSAFCQGNKQCDMVVALAVMKRDANVTSAVGGLRCKLRYEGSVQPAEGIFSLTQLSQEDEDLVTAVQLNCESKYPGSVPYEIIFFVNNVESYLHVEDSDTSAAFSSIGACLFPPSFKGNNDPTYLLLEQILLNSVFGIKHFNVYDAGFVSNKAARLLREAATELGLEVRILPFNSPLKLAAAMAAKLLEMDCYLRSKGAWETRVALGPSQVLVPRSAKTVGDVFKSAKSGDSLKVLRFCSEFPAEEAAAKNTYSLVALEQATYDSSFKDNNVKVFLSNGGGESSSVMAVEDMAVHDYSECDKLEFREGEAVRDAFLTDMADEVQEKVGRFFPHKAV